MKIIVVGGNNCWGKGDTFTEALKLANRPKAYVAYLTTDTTGVSDFNGALVYGKDDAKPALIDYRGVPKPEEREHPTIE